MADKHPIREEYAVDITDLQQAQRMITALRQELAAREEATCPLPNACSVVLDDDRAAKVERLFQQHRLFADQDTD